LRSVFLFWRRPSACRRRYVYFLCHLATKDPTSFTGPESYVSALVKTNDLSWLPLRSSIALQNAMAAKAAQARAAALLSGQLGASPAPGALDAGALAAAKNTANSSTAPSGGGLDGGGGDGGGGGE